MRDSSEISNSSLLEQLNEYGTMPFDLMLVRVFV
jgi:hypothetical protein